MFSLFESIHELFHLFVRHHHRFISSAAAPVCVLKLAVGRQERGQSGFIGVDEHQVAHDRDICFAFAPPQDLHTAIHRNEVPNTGLVEFPFGFQLGIEERSHHKPHIVLRFHSEYDLQNRAPLAGLYSTKACASRSFFDLFPVNRPPGPNELAASAILPTHSPRRLHITARDNSLTPEDRVYTLIPRYLSLRFGKTSDISQFSRRKSRYFDVKNNQYYPNRQVIHYIKSHRRHNKSAHSSDAARSIMRLFRTRLPRSCRTSTSPENRPEDHTARKTALREQQNVA